MTTPRPDQRHLGGPAGAAGSRSGSGDTAGALGFPGIPAAVVNCQSAQVVQQGAGEPVFFTFTGPGRVWTVVLSYAITSQAGFTGTVRTFAQVRTVLSGTRLAVIQLGVAAAGQVDSGQSEPSMPGLPMTQGESLLLSVNGGNPVAQLDQQARVVVLYSIP